MKVEGYEIELFSKEQREALKQYAHNVGASIVAETMCGEWCYFTIRATEVQVTAINALLSRG